jgi:hypothetical protein
LQQQFFQVVVVSLKIQGIAMLKKRIHAQLVVLVLIGLVQQMYSANAFVAKDAPDVDILIKLAIRTHFKKQGVF